jgi:hypothetical protein
MPNKTLSIKTNLPLKQPLSKLKAAGLLISFEKTQNEYKVLLSANANPTTAGAFMMSLQQELLVTHQIPTELEFLELSETLFCYGLT